MYPTVNMELRNVPYGLESLTRLICLLNIDSVLEKNKRLRKKYRRPDMLTDRLYSPDFVYVGDDGIDCNEVCGDGNLII